MGHCIVCMGHCNACVGYCNVCVGYCNVCLGHCNVCVGHCNVCVGHLRVGAKGNPALRGGAHGVAWPHAASRCDINPPGGLHGAAQLSLRWSRCASNLPEGR